ncbi:MAG: transposase, partial [Ruminococcus sp.]|nr:transposase [Ruminococcus sp.]
MVLEILLSAGTDADSTYAIELLSKLPIESSNILGDKAYGTQKIRTYITEAGAVYTI